MAELLDLEEDKTLDEVMEEVRCTARNHRHLTPENMEHMMASLLSAAAFCGVDCDANEMKKVANVIHEVGMLHGSSTRAVLLQYLCDLPQPIPFVGIVPSLFGMSSSHQLQEVFELLRLVLESDSQNILPVINALVDLPLTAEMKNDLICLIEKVIPIVDEKDIPFLFRTVMNNLDDLKTSRIPGKILNELSSLSFGTLSLVMDTLWEILPASPSACKSIIKHIKETASTGQQLSLMNTATTLIIFTTNCDSSFNKNNGVFNIWLNRSWKLFPFSHLETIIRRKDENEIWSRMLPSIWDTCLWILKYSVTDCGILERIYSEEKDNNITQITKTEDSFLTLRWRRQLGSSCSEIELFTSHAQPSLGMRTMRCDQLFNRILSLFMVLYEHAAEYRESIAKALLHRCFYTTSYQYINAATSHPQGNDSTASAQQFFNKYENIIRLRRDINESSRMHQDVMSLRKFHSRSFLPSVKDILHSDSSKNTSFGATSLTQMHAIAHLSMCLLENIVHNHPEIHSLLMTTLMDKMHSSSTSNSLLASRRSIWSPTLLSSCYDSSLTVLPSSLILHSFAASITSTVRSLQSTENTLLIFIQKLIGVSRQEDPLFLKVLCDSVTHIPCHKRGANDVDGAQHPPNADQNRRLSTCCPAYQFPTSCVGALLLSYMLYQYLEQLQAQSINVSLHIVQDALSLLSWLETLLGQCKDISVAYALDSLSVIAGAMQLMQRKASQEHFFDKVNSILKMCLRKVEKRFTLFGIENRVEFHENVERNNKRLTMLVFNAENSLSSVEDKIWKVSEVTQQLVQHGIPSEGQYILPCGASMNTLSNFVSSLCWVFQKAAMLEGALCLANDDLMKSSGGTLSLQNDTETALLPAFAISVTACNSDLALFDMLYKSPPHGIKKVNELQCWLCESTMEYWNSQKWRNTKSSTNGSLIQNLRMAWESALTGSIISGYLHALYNTLDVEDENECQSETGLSCKRMLLQLVGSFFRTRYFLRLVCPSAIEKGSGIKPKEVSLRKRKASGYEDDATVGGSSFHCEYSGQDNKDHSNVNPSWYHCHAKQEKNEWFFVQSYFIRRSIDRLSMLMPTSILSRSLDCIPIRHDISQLLNVNKLSPPPAMTEATMASSPLPILFTDAGLQLCIILCGKYLTYERIIPSHSNHFNIDPMITFQEFNLNRMPWDKSIYDQLAQSTSSSMMCEDIEVEFDPDKENLQKCMMTLVSYIPVLMHRADMLRAVESDLGDAPKEAVICDPLTGSPLSASGHYLLVSVLHMTLCSYLRNLEESTSEKLGSEGGDFFENVSTSTHISHMLDMMINYTIQLKHENGIGMFQYLSDEEREDLPGFGECEKLMILFRVMEAHALKSPNITVSLGAVKCLLSLSGNYNTHLECRIIATTWTLLKCIHEYTESSIFPEDIISGRGKMLHLNKAETNGSGLLHPFLRAFIRTPISDTSGESSHHIMNSGRLQQIHTQCGNLQQSIFAVARKILSKSASGFYQAAEQESFEGFTLLFSIWWRCGKVYRDTKVENDPMAITPCPSLRKIYGIFMLIFACFTRHDQEFVKSATAESPNYNSKMSNRLSTHDQGEKSEADRALPSRGEKSVPQRTSRLRKSVTRYEPENFLKGPGDIVESGVCKDNRPQGCKKRLRDNSSVSAGVEEPLQSSSAVKLCLRSRMKRKEIYVYHAKQIENSCISSDQRFRRITDVNYDAYLLFSMSYLPGLILSVVPSIPSEIEDSCDISVGPYQPFINAMQLFSWCIDEICELVCGAGVSDEQAQHFMTLIHHSVRISRNAVMATDYAIISNMEWRNSFTSIVSNRHGEMETDWASVDYLGEIFSWSKFFLCSVKAFATKLANKIMAAKELFIPKSLNRSLPSLKTIADNLLVKIERWKLENNCYGDDTKCWVKDDDPPWLRSLYEQACQFDHQQHEILRLPVPLSSWRDVHSTETTRNYYTHDAVSVENTEVVQNTINMMETTNGFGVSTSRSRSSTGWGWGSNDSDSSDSECSTRNIILESAANGSVKEFGVSDKDNEDIEINSSDSYDSDSECDIQVN